MVVHLAGGTTQPLFQINGTTPLTATDLGGLTGANAYVAGGDDLATYITDNSAQPNTSVDLSAPPAVDPAVRLKFSSAVTPNSSDSGQYEADDFAVALLGQMMLSHILQLLVLKMIQMRLVILLLKHLELP